MYPLRRNRRLRTTDTIRNLVRETIISPNDFLVPLFVVEGKGIKEVGYDKISKKNIIFVDKNYIRPLDVNTLLGNAKKARKTLSWKPKIQINQLIDEMISEEIKTINAE